MNNKTTFVVSVIAIIISVVAIVLTFVRKPQTVTKVVPTQQTSVSIAYVDIDTLVNHYDLYNALMISYMQKQQDYEKQLQSKLMSIQQRSMKLQNDYQKGLITTVTFQQKMQQLQNEQQSIQQWYQEKSQELMQDQQMITSRVMDSILNAINEINKDNIYQLIFTKNSLLYGDKAMDITDTLITLLNSKVDLNKLAQ